MGDYPKWLHVPDGVSLVVKSAEEEAAVLEGRASISVTMSAALGKTYEIVSIAPKPAQAPAPKGKRG